MPADTGAMIGDRDWRGRRDAAGALQQVLREQGKRMVTAESCTGGLIALTMTAEPGSSVVLEAGFVTMLTRSNSQCWASTSRYWKPRAP